jgi:hypothetical protein
LSSKSPFLPPRGSAAPAFLFFELNQISKGPQLILKHAVKAQQQMGTAQMQEET